MSRQPVPGHEPSDPELSPSREARPAEGRNFENDLVNLTARFTELGGSPELSSDLALQIVLNEIVEQACLATGATGAAIVLEREGEMVCRATSGSTAPELGSRLDTDMGLSGLCVKTRLMQKCDDVLADERVDLEASRQLGVRSVIVIPLLRGMELVGVFEAFSSRASAFGQRDEGTLEVLAGRALNSLEQAAQADKRPELREVHRPEHIPEHIEEQQVAQWPERRREQKREEEIESLPAIETIFEPELQAELLHENELESQDYDADISSEHRFDFVTWGLVAAVVVCALALAILVGRHFVGPLAASREHPVGTAASSSSSVQTVGSDAGASVAAPFVVKHADAPAAQTARAKLGAGPTAPPGGLLIYENGKEVFRAVPAEQPTADAARDGSESSAQPAAQSTAVQPASSIEADNAAAAGITELSGVTDADLVRRIEPEYPEAARAQGIEGAVVLDVRASADGVVQHISLISGQPPLADAAIAAVQHWQFKPRVVHGQAVPIATRITLNFRLSR